jgi:hypothetical protein
VTISLYKEEKQDPIPVQTCLKSFGGPSPTNNELFTPVARTAISPENNTKTFM